MRRFVTVLFAIFLVVLPTVSTFAQEAPANPAATGPSDETLSLAPLADVADPAQPFRERVIELTNTQRQAQNLLPLSENSALTSAAQGHADWMASSGCFDHVCPDEPLVDARLLQAGYSWSWWAENIAFGYPTPEQVVDGWMNSPGHRANILNPNLREIGVGVILDGKRPYWVEDFGAAR